MNDEDAKITTHESYGMAGFYRTQGGHYNLFGSAINHNNTISLVVSRGEHIRRLNTDWYHAKEQLIEVRFSQTQFAELLTTMNCGNGVPCTLEYVYGKQMPPCPEVNKKREIQNEFRDRMKELGARLSKITASADALAANSKPTKADRESLRKEIGRLVTEITSNLPFVAECFAETVEETVTQAKGEIDAAFTNAVHRMGMEALHQSIGADRITVPALEDKSGDLV